MRVHKQHVALLALFEQALPGRRRVSLHRLVVAILYVFLKVGFGRFGVAVSRGAAREDASEVTVDLLVDLSRETLEYSIRIAVCADMWAPNVTDDGCDVAVEVKTTRCCHRLAVSVEISFVLPSTIETLERAKVDCTIAL